MLKCIQNIHWMVLKVFAFKFRRPEALKEFRALTCSVTFSVRPASANVPTVFPAPRTMAQVYDLVRQKMSSDCKKIPCRLQAGVIGFRGIRNFGAAEKPTACQRLWLWIRADSSNDHNSLLCLFESVCVETISWDGHVLRLELEIEFGCAPLARVFRTWLWGFDFDFDLVLVLTLGFNLGLDLNVHLSIQHVQLEHECLFQLADDFRPLLSSAVNHFLSVPLSDCNFAHPCWKFQHHAVAI